MKEVISDLSWSELIMIFALICIVIAILMGLSYYLSNKKKKKEEETAREKKEREDLERGYRHDFTASSSKKKRLISHPSGRICIVVEEKEKNVFTFSFSRPLKALELPSFIQKTSNGVTGVTKLNDYQFLVTISPAAEIYHVCQEIARLFFKKLEEAHEWLYQKVAIKIRPLSDSKLGIVIPGLNLSRSHIHENLSLMLENIDGVKEVYSEYEEIILFMDHCGQKALSDTKNILTKYFIGGIEFIDETPPS